MSRRGAVLRAKGIAVASLASPVTWYTAVVGYLVLVVVILAPVLFTSISSDDSYWILETPGLHGGSYWDAYLGPLLSAFDFSGQPRTTALATAERRVIALLTMDLATLFAVPPAMIWGAIKLSLLGGMVTSIAIFLRVHRFRGIGGQALGFDRATRVFVVLALPLAIAIGAKSINIATLNSWNHYPTLTYGPIAVYFLVASLAVLSERWLRRWSLIRTAVVVVIFAVIGVATSISYELIALVVPVAVLALVLQPLPEARRWWERWRPRATVALSLGLSYTVMFAWTRWNLSQMACHATDSCYEGTVVEINPLTIWNNFLGAFPGRDGGQVVEAAIKSGQDVPVVNSGSVTIAIGVALLFGLAWASWRVRNTEQLRRLTPRDSSRGVISILVVCALVAVGGAVITGISANAVAQLSTAVLSYRSGVLIWTALALGLLMVVRLITMFRWRWAEVIALTSILLVAVVAISLYSPRNVAAAQIDRSRERVVTIDRVQWEVVLGDASDRGDARRCESIELLMDSYREYVPRISRIVRGAYAAYEHYHSAPYCSTGFGLDAETDMAAR